MTSWRQLHGWMRLFSNHQFYVLFLSGETCNKSDILKVWNLLFVNFTLSRWACFHQRKVSLGKQRSVVIWFQQQHKPPKLHSAHCTVAYICLKWFDLVFSQSEEKLWWYPQCSSTQKHPSLPNKNKQKWHCLLFPSRTAQKAFLIWYRWHNLSSISFCLPKL